MNPIDKAHSLIPLMKDWPPADERKAVDVYALSGIPKPPVTKQISPRDQDGPERPANEDCTNKSPQRVE